VTNVTNIGRFGSGQAVRRMEDKGLLMGAGLFTDDASLPDQAHIYVLRSPHPHARILSVDTTAASTMPGVVAILTGADLAQEGLKPLGLAPMFQRPDGKPPSVPLRGALAVDVARYVGDPIAAVVAESRAAARDAAEAIEVAYEPLPHAVGIRAAVAPGAPALADMPDNYVAVMRHGDAAKAADAFAKAAHVVSVDITNQRLAPVAMEPRSTLGTFDPATGRITLRMSTQMPSSVRDALCDQVLGIPQKDVRVVVGDVGGGFGMKTHLYPEDMLVAYFTRKLNRPVKCTMERIEEFLGAMHGRDIESHAELALDAQGKVLAYRIKTLADVGAYPDTVGILIQLLIGPFVSTSIYDIQTIDFDLQAVLTNTTPTSAYRGAGRPEAIFLIERLMDKAARQLGLDPTEIRRRNMIKPEQMPYTNAMGQTYDSGKFEQVMNLALKHADWNGFEARAADSAKRGKVRGRGLATFLEWTGGNVLEERVTVSVKGDGEIEVFASTMPMGQGIMTSYAQLVVDAFGVPLDKVKIVMGDTDRGAGFGSAGSRSLFTAGSALKVASDKAVASAKELAADALEVSVGDVEYVEGVLQVPGTDHRIDLFELAARQPDKRIYIDSSTAVGGPTWPNGAHICEVEIDPQTGHVDIVGYASINDVGKAVNPMIVKGQLDGGAVQGLGQALCEQVVFDDASGQALTASFMDYAMPRADIVEAFHNDLDQSTPCVTNPLGVKGVGELGTIGATPALVNAVSDALVRAGKAKVAETIQMPLTPERVWTALHG
jgi:carbon-monoxide dehydrogenase large subunit